MNQKDLTNTSHINVDTEAEKITIEFMPGCFDNFEGTQEELDELVNEIRRLIDTGELFEKAVPLDMDDLDIEDIELIEPIGKKRTLQ